MRTAIAAIFSAASLIALTGCDSNAEPTASSMLTYQVDSASQRSWWLTRDGVVLHGAASAKGRSIPLPGWLWAGAPVCPPDLALGPRGEAVVTSNVIPTVWRIDAGTLAVSVHELRLSADNDKDVGFVAIVYVPEQASFLAYSESPRAVWKIDRQLTSATKVSPADLSRMRSARSISVRGPCAEVSQRLSQLAGIAEVP
jgi:hypothetical protein